MKNLSRVPNELWNMPVLGLKTCMNFLGFDLPNSVIQCLQRNQEGSFHRPKRHSVEICNIFLPFRIYVKSILVILKKSFGPYLKLQNLKCTPKKRDSKLRKSISRKIFWVSENFIIFHTVICKRPPEETQIILDLIPEYIRTKIEVEKTQSMQVLLENSVHSDFGYILYGQKATNQFSKWNQ